MRALLAHPRVAGLLSDDEPVATVLRITSVARFTPGCNPKDVALVQVGFVTLGYARVTVTGLGVHNPDSLMVFEKGASSLCRLGGDTPCARGVARLGG